MRSRPRLIVLLSVLLTHAATAGEVEPPVSIDHVANASYAFVTFEDLFRERTDYEDLEECAEPSCATSAQVSETFSADVVSGSGTGTGNASHTVTLDPGGGILAEVTAQGSSDASARSSGSVSGFDAATDAIPRGGGAASGSTASGGGGAVSFGLETTVPAQLDFSGSLSVTGDSDAGIQIRDETGQLIMEAELDPQNGISNPPAPFSIALPPGRVTISAYANGFALECGIPCDTDNEGSASFSLTATLTRGPQDIRWINAAGGSWDDPENWEPQQVPGEEDRALFDLDASYSVDFPLAAAAARAARPRGAGEPAVSIATPLHRSHASLGRTGLADTVQEVDDCEEPSCGTQASLSDSFSVNGFSGSVSCSTAADASFSEDAGGAALTVSGGAGSDLSVSNGDGPGGVAESDCVSSYRSVLETTVPLQLDVAGTLAQSATARAELRVNDVSSGTVLVSGRFDDSTSEAPVPFSGVVPPGTYSVEVSASSSSFASCEPSCSGFPGGDASFSLTLRLSSGPQAIRWVNAAGGSWDDAENWEPEQVPGEEDRAVFDLDASYSVDFPLAAAAAGAPRPRGAIQECVGSRTVDATRIRAGTPLWTGAVDVATLADAPEDPGLRVGGESVSDSPLLTVEGGQLCSLFATLGDTGRGGAEMRVLASDWINTGRLRVGDAGPARLSVGTDSFVQAGETRVGRAGGGAIEIDEGELDAGSLLVGAPELALGETAEVVVALGHLRTDGALVGTAPGVCLGDAGAETTGVACALHEDCLDVGREECSRVQRLLVESGATWAADGSVAIGGGAIQENGVLEDAPGSALLFVPGDATLADLSLGNGRSDPQASLTQLPRGETVVPADGTIEVLGELRVGNGGIGRLFIEGTGQVSAAETRVGLPPELPLHPDAAPHGLLDVRGEPLGGPGDPAALATQLVVQRSGRVVLHSGRIAGTTVVEAGGELFMADEGAGLENVVLQAGARAEFFPADGAPPAATNARVARAGLPAEIDGDFTVAPGAVLAVRVADPTACHSVRVAGDASLGGTLELLFEDGALPAQGDACPLLQVEGVASIAFEQVVVRGASEGFRYQATVDGAGEVSFEALSDAAPCSAGDTDGDGIADCERCDDCIDDDGDGLIDRDDPDCVAPADGGGLGLADPAAAAGVLRCHKALRGATKSLASKTWKRLHKCADAVQSCLQRKPGDPRCVEKVARRCARAAEKLVGEKGPAARAEAKIAKACAAVPLDALRDVAGLGHGAAEGACAAAGVPALASPEAIAACVSRRQRCQVGGLLGAALPRARELLTAAGAAHALPCLPITADGGGAGLDDPKGAGKRLVKCQKALGRAAGKLLAQALDAGASCEAGVLACLQRGGDAACLARAEASCARADGKRAAAEDKLLAAVEKQCGERKGTPLVAVDALLADAGLGFGAAAPRCEALGVSPLQTHADVAACLVAEQTCREQKLREAATPRSAELTGLGLGP